MLREGRLDEIPDAAKDKSLRRYVEQRVALKAQIAFESRTLLPQHPRMKELNGELAGLDGEIRLAANKAVLALENDAKLAGAEVDSLSAALAKQSKTVATGNVDGRAIARARTRRQDVARTARILPAEVSRGPGARGRQRRAGGRAHHRQRERTAHADLPQEGADGAARHPRRIPRFSFGVVAAHALLADAAGASDGAAATPLGGRERAGGRRDVGARWRGGGIRGAGRKFTTPFPPPRRSPTGSPRSRGTARR